MGWTSREAHNAYDRAWRAKKAIAAGRVPGRTGRPPTGRKGPKCHGDRIGQQIRARARDAQRRADNGWVETRHPVLDEAIIIARRHARPDHGLVIFDPLYEDAVCVAALAICAGEDPEGATLAFVRKERDWAYRTHGATHRGVRGVDGDE